MLLFIIVVNNKLCIHLDVMSHFFTLDTLQFTYILNFVFKFIFETVELIDKVFLFISIICLLIIFDAKIMYSF